MAGLLRRMFGGSGSSQLLEAGSAAPNFQVTAHDGTTVRLAELRGKKVVLWFYPKADTPG